MDLYSHSLGALKYETATKRDRCVYLLDLQMPVYISQGFILKFQACTSEASDTSRKMFRDARRHINRLYLFHAILGTGICNTTRRE